MLTKRLLACADFIRKNSRVADIGTDHALLPCHLVLSGMASCAIAADVNEKPLSRAADTIARLKLDDKVTTVLSDGLSNLDLSSIDDIIIAGMGGELISRLVLECDELKNPEKHLILQPMKRASYLRESLYKNGFFILAETPIFENGHHYSAILCRYGGEVKEIDEIFARIGKIPNQTTNELMKEAESYLEFEKSRAEKIANGLRKSANATEEEKKKAARYEEMGREIWRGCEEIMLLTQVE